MLCVVKSNFQLYQIRTTPRERKKFTIAINLRPPSIQECASTHNSQPSPPYISMIRHQAGSQASQAESRRVQEAYPWSSRPPAGPPEARAHASNLQPSLLPSAAAARRSSCDHFANTRRAPSATVPAVKTVSTVCFVIGVGRPRAAQTANRQRSLHWTSIPMPASAIPA